MTPPLLSLLPFCKTLNHLKSIHAHLTILNHPFNPTTLLSTLTYLLPSPLPLSSLPYALSLFHLIPSPSAFPYNLLIRIHTLLLPSPLPALALFARMRRESVSPDPHTFPFALTACARLPHPLPLARSLHSLALRSGLLLSDPFAANSLLHIYSSYSSLLPARRLFDEIPLPDIVSHNTLIDAYVKAGDLTTARTLFNNMPARDLVSWGTLLAGYSQASRCVDAIELFDRMLASGLNPDDVAIVSALSCCAQMGALERGKAIHDYIVRNKVRMNVYLSTGLVDMYTKCGCISVAREIFESSSCRNLFTWNAIIVGLAMHGHGELSLEYFDRMLGSGVRPDGVSFLGVLVGCSHAGLTDRARGLFGEMESVYRVRRELKHYGCMTDLLGRAGLIEEAMEIIKGMPMEGDAYVWGGVLGGCRIHGNVDVAEVAAEHLLKLNSGDSGIYSIMASIYATSGRWDDVARMRRLMDDNKINKNVGRSSIQVQGINHG